MKLATVLCNNPIICKVYDSITQQSFWRQAINRMIDLAGPIPDGSQILDLGTGPGISAFALASRIQTPTQIVGVDLKWQMPHACPSQTIASLTSLHTASCTSSTMRARSPKKHGACSNQGDASCSWSPTMRVHGSQLLRKSYRSLKPGFFDPVRQRASACR